MLPIGTPERRRTQLSPAMTRWRAERSGPPRLSDRSPPLEAGQRADETHRPQRAPTAVGRAGRGSTGSAGSEMPPPHLPASPATTAGSGSERLWISRDGVTWRGVT